MPLDKNDFLVRLDNALKNSDRCEIEVLCAKLLEDFHSPDTVPDEQFAVNVLASLQRKRCFKQLSKVADACIQKNIKTVKIRRQYAQSLIENGDLSTALDCLNSLILDIENSKAHKFEHTEAKGLIGRIHKQQYININDPTSPAASSAINMAIQAYLEVYNTNPESYTWHGINSAALLSRAATDNITVENMEAPRLKAHEIAEQILAYISQLWEDRRATMWDSGTAMEACVALNSNQEAITWLKRYIREPQTDAFELGSTLRQMQEVWRLNLQSEPGATIIPILRSELLQKEGGTLSVSARDLRLTVLEKKPSENLEKILGNTGYHNYKFMLRSIDRARTVARIEHNPGEGYGTGFLVPADQLHEKLGGGYVLLTNAHVVSDDSDVQDALAPEDAIVTFQMLQEEGAAEEEYAVEELLWTSPPWKLDTTILRLKRLPEGFEDVLIHPRLPLADGEQRVYIIGHPRGGSLSFSIQDNVLLDHEDPYLHYRAPTEGGSSGSPVFNSQWKLIGLHHAGSTQMQKLNGQTGIYEANEGIWIQSVRRKLEEELSM